jgi:predicted HD phosphohydrolase
MNIDKNLRERFRSSPYFEACENFCEKWDETSFDPNYSSLPLSHFEPMLLRLLEKKIYSAQDLNDPLNAAKKDLNVYDFDDWMGNNAEN